MPIRTVGLTPGHRWCGGLRSVKPAVNNGKGAPGLVHGPNSLNATYIRPGHISDRPRKLAKDLRNGHLVFRQSSIDRFLKLEVPGIQEIPASAARQLKMDGTLELVASYPVRGPTPDPD